MTRRAPLLTAALSAAVLVPLAGLAAPASGAATVAPAATARAAAEVRLVLHTVTSGRGATAASEPVVTGVAGLPAAASRAVAADLTRQARLLVAAGKRPQTSVTVSVQLTEQDALYTSVRFATSTYAAGAAHPVTVPTTVTYVRASGRRLGIGDLFKGHLPAALQALSRKTRALLPAVLPSSDRAEIAAGTRPTTADLGTVVPRVGGLEVVFPPYQVAAYVFDSPAVVVPWSALKGLTAVPLPRTVEPAPPYLGGIPVSFGAEDITRAVRASRLPALVSAERAPSRLTDPVFLVVDDDPSSTTYQLVRLVPLATPAAALTVALRDTGSGLTVVDAQRGAAGCRVFPPAVLRALRAGCR